MAQADHIHQLEEKIASLKREVSSKDEVLRYKNLALDALHYVWCNGNCDSGVCRYHEYDLTEEMVQEAERNTKGLRQKFNNLQAKKSRLPDHNI